MGIKLDVVLEAFPGQELDNRDCDAVVSPHDKEAPEALGPEA